MILPDKVYNALPYAWAACAFASVEVGITAILSSLLFMGASVCVFLSRQRTQTAKVVTATYFAFLLAVALVKHV